VSVPYSPAPASASCVSRAVIDANVAAVWNVRPTPAVAMRCGGKPSMRPPASHTEPASAPSWPLMMLKQVVLPAPLGPISATISPAPSAKETSSSA
jgi:hypothetical protein